MKDAGTLRYEVVRPEPSSFWVRHAPTAWPGPVAWWIDLARAEPAGTNLRSGAASLDSDERFHDVVYIPPVAAGARSLPGAVAAQCAEMGVPVIQQLLPGQEPVADLSGIVVVDLTPSLLDGPLDELQLPAGCWALWPLLSGMTDDSRLALALIERLQNADVAGVLPLVPALTPDMKRRLSEVGAPESWAKLFHPSREPDLGEAVQLLAGAGLPVFPARPPLSGGWRARNRELSAHFALLGELWLICGRPAGRAQIFFSVARRLDEEPLDVGEAARRGGMAGIEWLDEEGVREVVQAAQGGPTELRRELEAEAFRGDASV